MIITQIVISIGPSEKESTLTDPPSARLLVYSRETRRWTARSPQGVEEVMGLFPGEIKLCYGIDKVRADWQ